MPRLTVIEGPDEGKSFVLPTGEPQPGAMPVPSSAPACLSLPLFQDSPLLRTSA